MTLQKRKKKVENGPALVLRDAPRKPTAGRDRSETVLSMEVWVCGTVVELVLPLGVC